jgi:hypothetical protein
VISPFGKMWRVEVDRDGDDAVRDGHKGPLNNQGKPAYLHKKQTQTNLKTSVG